MTIDAAGRGHNPAGTPGGGQFNGHNRPDASGNVALTVPPSAPTVENLTELIKGLDAHAVPDLTYVAYDDQLNEEQVQAYLAGDDDTLYDSTSDWISEQSHDSAETFLREFCQEHGADYDMDFDADEQMTLREAVYDKDTSDPVKQLIQNTPDQLMRAPLISDAGSLLNPDEDGHWPEGVDPRFDYGGHSYEAIQVPRVRALEEALRSHGVTITPEVTTAVEEIVNNGPSNWHEAVDLDVITYSDIRDLQASPTDGVSLAPGRKLTFTGAEVVLIDRMNGSGYSARIPGTLTTTITADRPAFLDSPRNSDRGYGWDDVAGVYKPAFRPDSLASEWLPSPECEPATV
ncbi:hypothetical protein [Curtobacterium sp. MCSS17_016]|uniref:hypothetical protein n=1 Tax=Curtobacterium sp. MCSS17_016 TaxID=2175644 RepID=UPI000DA8DC85|nr:hypothetical protein [Curtobacterium sp. MCSS17_016]WIE81195.1 hypothetical protein DEJ19_018350 [Curtobacterium sp. MCSS17_016]